MGMNHYDPADAWRRLEAKLEERLGREDGATLPFHTLILLCGEVEAEDDPDRTYTEGDLLRLGLPRATRLKRRYDDRFGPPPDDVSGQRAYQTEIVLALVYEQMGMA